MKNKLMAKGKVIERISSREDRLVGYGTACKYVKEEHEYYDRITNIETGKLISVDHIKTFATEHKVIYLGMKTKVIIRSQGKEFTGLSICHEDDFFTVQNGYDIAYKKAQIKQLQYELKILCE